VRVGVLDLLVDAVPSPSWLDNAYRAIFKKQYASITPQAVSVWCRQLGHRVWYATYYGQCDPGDLLPADLDVVFVSAYTQASGLAYALAKLYRARGARTVIGGPHARSFSRDCLRFFDLAVLDCDRALVRDIVRGVFDPGSIVGSGRVLTDLPTVEERMPEIRRSLFARGRPVASTTVPLLTSVGCPYRCDFCIDWNTPYSVLPRDRLAADLRYLSRHWPQVMVTYHDPNFAVRFDEVVSVMEGLTGRCNPYIMESSLSVLKGPRLRRLRDTNCIYVAPGVESWTDYSGKAGVGRLDRADKLVEVVEHFRLLHAHGFGLQANFIFGTAGDEGEEPAELTKAFIRALPCVWPTVNVPTPFGGTPLYDAAVAERRLLRPMPFAFYYTPYLVMQLEHYEPADYYQKLIDIYSTMVSTAMLGRRLLTKATWGIRTLHVLRTFGMRQDVAAFVRLRRLLVEEPGFRAFHEGRADALPAFYHREYERKLGRYAELVGPTERVPVLEPAGGSTGRAPVSPRRSGAEAEPGHVSL
jgi:radical SAM superfamily enzyme YgiQ (UPF0313 family)